MASATCLTGFDAGFIQPGRGSPSSSDWSDTYGGVEVLVSRSHTTSYHSRTVNGFVYKVTFLHAPANLPALQLDVSNVKVGNATAATISQLPAIVSRPAMSLSGLGFRFELGLESTDWMLPEVSAQTMRDQLESMDSIHRVIVEKEVPSISY